jgi:hypothetical protein
MSHSRRVALLALLIGGGISNASAALAASSTKLVRYHGFSVSVPRSWPVYDLGRAPTTCVRFNRHAVYLGVPGRTQRCPAHSIGRTESILVSPLSAAGAGADARSLPLEGAATVVHRRGLSIAATWGRDPGQIARALGLRGPLRPAAAARGPAAHLAAAPTAHAAGVTYTGRGFDACSAPSTQVMSDWASSPYRAIGIYIGGANMGCSQPNLTASWVRAEAAAGWRFIPTYVGLQAPATSCGCATITPSKAAAQGTAAASDAVTQAQLVGIGKGNPIYFDMEAYGPSGSSTALSFLAAWTAGLHAAGYLSGVYSSGASGISDLVNQYGTTYQEPNDLWIADWNGSRTVSDPYVPSADWATHQRVHQYDGGANVTYGGDTINIDGDYLDGATAGPGTGGSVALFPDGTFIQVSGIPYVYRIAGGAPLYVSSWTGFGGPQVVSAATQQQFDSLPDVPFDGTMLESTTGQLYRVAGGAALPVSNASALGVTPAPVLIDAWDIANVGTPLAHLQTAPATGTVVEGLPSKTYWSFQPGGRRAVSATPGAIAVNDNALASYPVLPPTTGATSPAVVPHCVVPTLRRKTINQARTALTRAHCRLGTIHRPRHPLPHHTLRVVTQSARAASRHTAGYRVAITVR